MKNSEKVLKECLESVRDILKRDDCELVIADTGSSDSSKKIAASYTDKIFDFEWTDDFSAARNFCIEKAAGEWVFFIDTDEILENPKKLTDFIDNQTNAADYAFTALRKYNTNNSAEYTDTFPIRLFKRSEIKYKNAVCEIPEKISGNGTYTDIVIKHNFVFNADRFRYFDSILTKAYNENSDDWYINLKMMENSALKEEVPDIEKYGKRAAQLSGENNINAVCALIDEYVKHKNYYKAELLIKQYIEQDLGIYSIPIYSVYLDILHRIVRYDDMDKIYNLYLNAFAEYKKGSFNNEINVYLLLSGHSDASFRINTIRYINSLIGRGMYEKAEEMLKTQLPPDIYRENFSDIEERIRCELKLLQKSGNFEKFPECFERFSDICRKGIINVLDSIYKDITDDISEELSVFYEKGGEGAYESILKLRYADLCGKDIEDAHTLIENALTDPEETKDILYYIFKYEYPITEWTDKIDPFDVNEMFNILSSYGYKNTLKMSELYLDGVDEIHTLEDIIVISQLYEIIFSRLNADEFDKGKAEEILSVYTMVMNQYMNVIYKEEVLNDNDIYRLPSNIIFAYFASKALDKKNEGNIKEYLADLNKALQAKQIFNPIIMVLLQAVKEQLELDEQYKKIKMLIKHCINTGEITNAYSYLTEYAKMNPADPELESLMDMLEEAAK